MSARVAIIAGEDSLLLEALLEAWSDSELLDVDLKLVSPVASPDAVALHDGQPLAFTDIADFDFGQVQCVMVLSPAIVVEAYRDMLANLACPVLGFMDNLACLGPTLFDNTDSSATGITNIVGVLQPSVAALQYALAGFCCEAVDVTALYPASFYGVKGVQELAAQATRLLNMQPFDNHVFDQQLPFNYFPMSVNAAGVHLEGQLRDELRQVFVNADVHLTALQMPVFYGVSLLVSVTLDDEVDVQSILDIWAKKQLISYQEAVKQLSNMESLEHNGEIVLGNLRKRDSDEYRMDFWLGFDDVKFSARHNLISAAEFLLKHHL